MASLPLPPSTGQVNTRPEVAPATLYDQAQLSQQAVGANQARQAELAQRKVQDAGPVGGQGFLGSLSSALMDSPQLQSGVLAAGLSLLFGNDPQSSVTAGLSAAAGYNEQDEANTQQKKAEAAGMLKQQSQLENSYAEANYRDRLPQKDNSYAIAQLGAGANAANNAIAWEQLRDAKIERLMTAAPDGTPGMSYADAYAAASGRQAQSARTNEYVLTGVKAAGKEPGKDAIIPGSAAVAEITSAYKDYSAATAANVGTQAERDRALLNHLRKIQGVKTGLKTPADAVAYAKSLYEEGVKPAGKAGVPAAKGAPAPKPASPAPAAKPQLQLPPLAASLSPTLETGTPLFKRNPAETKSARDLRERLEFEQAQQQNLEASKYKLLLRQYGN